MKKFYIVYLIALSLTIIGKSETKAQNNSGAVAYASMTEMSDLSGGNKQMIKIGVGTVTPSTGDGYSIDISGMGLTNVIGFSIIPIKNTATPTTVPKISIKSQSTSAIVVNIIEGNPNTVNILGNLVLLGTSEVFANTTGLTLKVVVYGN